MYYLFKFIKEPGKNTYSPDSIYSKLTGSAKVSWVNKEELNKSGFSHISRHKDCKFLYLKIDHENVVNSSNFKKIKKLVINFERTIKLNKLL